MTIKKKNILVGLSGGVDSSATCLVLKLRNFNVYAIHMVMWDKAKKYNTTCTFKENLNDAKNVCENLKIPFYTHFFQKEYKKFVFNNYIEDYKKGYTPNPDTSCNKSIKFKYLTKTATTLGIKKIATGHYAKKKKNLVIQAKDYTKDQTYFLTHTHKNNIKNTEFPLEDYYKKQVRRLTFLVKLHTSTKKDSYGVCFIEPKKFNAFIGKFIKKTPGKIKNTNGSVLGTHNGVPFYTIGQKIILREGNQHTKEYYVYQKNKKKNIILVARKEESVLLTKKIPMSSKHLSIKKNIGIFYFNIKTRHTENCVSGVLLSYGKKNLLLLFKKHTKIATKQVIAFYYKRFLLGGCLVNIIN